ncbi:MAG: thiamine biosynthesis protein ThiS [Desulfobacula sp.]|nr:thiamine biosynthesis protein ThiS [Desulfobacula sp.]
MPKITFNAFSFLGQKLKEKGIPCSNELMTVESGTKARELISMLGLSPDEVEVVFINGRVGSRDAVLKDKDRVALIPPGTPGPYRVLLGFISQNKNDRE